MANERNKFIADNISVCLKNLNKLTDWEVQFVDSIRKVHNAQNELTQKQFNTLSRIAQKVK